MLALSRKPQAASIREALGGGSASLGMLCLVAALSLATSSGCRSTWPDSSDVQARNLLQRGDSHWDAELQRTSLPPQLVRAVPNVVPVSTTATTTLRAQDGGVYGPYGGYPTAPSNNPPANSGGLNPGVGPTGLPRGPMPPSGTNFGAAQAGGMPSGDTGVRQAQAVEPGYPTPQPPGDWSGAPRGMIPYSPIPYEGPNSTAFDTMGLPNNFADLDAVLDEAQTGRFMIGAGINSDAGVTGQVIYDERNFDIRAFPRSWRDFIDGYAFRGAGQNFRVEAYPGSEVQRYMVSFNDPYFQGTPISFGVSGYFFDRNYFDWDEQRFGGRVSFGYRLTQDIALTVAGRGESIDIMNPRVASSPTLNSALGDSELFTGQVSLTHDTRDNPFAATEGYYLELAFQQAFGSYDFPRGDLTYNRYFLMRERPDGSGRHTVMLSTSVGVSGSQTPIYENYFAGGFSTLRGFDFRGASPLEGGVRVGGEFRWINTVEYLFPLTADDMIKGVVFCDFGTVEEKVGIDWDDFRLAPGFGFRVSIPRMGNGAPLAFDFAFPVLEEDGDDNRVFSFFMGFTR